MPTQSQSGNNTWTTMKDPITKEVFYFNVFDGSRKITITDKTNRNVRMNNDIFLRACHLNNMKVVRIGLDMGIDVNIQDDNQMTPLMIACKNGNTEMVAWLLE
jgi:ankyrin repeat protein